MHTALRESTSKTHDCRKKGPFQNVLLLIKIEYNKERGRRKIKKKARSARTVVSTNVPQYTSMPREEGRKEGKEERKGERERGERAKKAMMVLLL